MMMLGSLIILALGGALAWRLLQQPGRRPPSQEGMPEALRILEERYARGEITQQEFEERRRTLRGY